MEGEEKEASGSKSSKRSAEGEGEEGVPEYERRRLSRIRENRARLEALGLPRLASSLAGSVSQQRKSAKRVEDGEEKGTKTKRGLGDEDDDEDYRPSDDDAGADGEEEEGEASPPGGEEEEEDEDEEVARRKPSSISRRKEKTKNLSSSKKLGGSSTAKDSEEASDVVVDDDTALQQAIALSLGGSMEDSVAKHTSRSKKDTRSARESAGKRKAKKPPKSRPQLTEDEVIAFFFSFDEVGKGYITIRDLQRMAGTHDFSWTTNEIAKMIHCFDSHGDGKLRLDDFRRIISRCNMLQAPGEWFLDAVVVSLMFGSRVPA